ncbi:MAG TPA: hypothetical protein VK425_13260 [Acidimicrobiales bacterium]|nr:hypothetical protein [Acidimicrobiales bacterium]
MTGLALALLVILGAVPVLASATGTGGAAIACNNTDPILGPLHSSAALAAGTTGSLQLGGINGGKGRYVGNCLLNGTIPAGWKVAEASWVAMSATSGSGNAGTFTLDTPDSVFVDTGTFTNSGTFEDASSGLTQMVKVGDFVNTGSFVADGGSFGTAGAAFNPPCPSCTFVDRGTVQVDPKQGFSSGSIFVLAPGGTISAQGSFGIANESVFDVDGGSVTAGVPTSAQYLGLSAPTIKFGSALPPTSYGTIDVTSSAYLQGVIAKHWALDVTGGAVTANNAGNAGTFVWNKIDNSSLSGSTPFVNSGTFTDNATGWVQDIEVPSFVNTGTVTSNAPGFGMAGVSGGAGPAFVNRGDLVVAPKASFSATGTFDLASGAVINHGAFGIDGTTLDVSGGSILGKPATDVYYLGAKPATVTFEPPAPPSSTGAIDMGIGLTVNGVIPKHWVIDNVGGPGPSLSANHSGNNGTLIWGAGGPLTTTGTFVNSGLVDVTGGTMNITAADFVNAPGGKVVVESDGAVSGSGNLRNDGSLEIGPGNRVSVSSNYSQATAADLAVSAAGAFSAGSLSADGTADLGGALTVDKLAGLKVAPGDTAQIVTAHALAGRFKTVAGLAGPGPALAITYGPTAITLEPYKAA